MALHRLPTLLALIPLAGASLVPVTMAAAETGEPPAASTPAPAPAPVVRQAPEALAPAAPLAPPAASSTPAPLQASPDQLRASPPRRFDADLDALIRDGVVTPGERVRVRGTILTPGQDAGIRREACASGALSAQECRTGVVVRGRGRPFDAQGQPGAPGFYGDTGFGSTTPGATYGAVAGDAFFSPDAPPLPPLTVPVSALMAGAGGSFRLTDVFRVTPRPAPIAGNRDAGLLFPLIGTATISSDFGMRLHPVLGSWMMHAGRDFAAPEGTPVVAALSGKVVSSGLAGGYGLAVEIEHSNPSRRTLYAHLSELYVKAGETVRQGEVIGRVGSTGLSTGPHLHFELRFPQDGGWVAVAPGSMDAGGNLLIAGLPGLGMGGGDAVAMLVGQLIQTLERPELEVAARPPATAPDVAPGPTSALQAP